MFLQTKGFLGPIQKIFFQIPGPIIRGIRGVTNPTKDFFYSLYHLREIAKENFELENSVIALKLEVAKVGQLEKDNESLRQELGFAKSTKLELVPCNVISSSAFGFSDLITLNCGSEHGIAEGQAIIFKSHLVGKIIYTSKDFSTARLVTSSNFVTDAKISKTGQSVQVEGSFGSGVVMDKLPQNQTLEKGWLVVTAGINEKIPRNILIGEVGEILSTQSDLFKKAVLVSPVDFSDLEFVFAIK